MKLYHYTDVGAVKAILEHNKLRMTDMRFLNDSEELAYGAKFFIQDIKAGRPHHRLHRDYADLATCYVADELTRFLESGFSNHPIYSCSFSKAADLLSQWRAYGRYAIELDSEKLNLHLVDCIYETGEIRSKTFDSLVEMLRGVGRDLRKYAGEIGLMGRESYLDLLKLIASIKHPSFSEEQEVRFLADNRMSAPLDKNFRERGEILVPYVEIPIPFESISAIHVGPMQHQEMAIHSMSEYVTKICDNKKQNHKIMITRSTTPYRTA